MDIDVKGVYEKLDSNPVGEPPNQYISLIIRVNLRPSALDLFLERGVGHA